MKRRLVKKEKQNILEQLETLKVEEHKFLKQCEKQRLEEQTELDVDFKRTKED